MENLYKVFARKILHALMAPEDIQKELRVIEAVCKNDTQENIVKVLGTGMLKMSSLYFVDMERCDLTLREYLQGKLPTMSSRESMNEDGGLFFKEERAWLSVQKAWYITEHTSKGINFIHSKGLVHRDINPNNSKSHKNHES